MSYQVLARKWRPHDFSEVVGQEHVLRALINALDQNRLHHAFLFTGTRGVGKTTLARILAKCLNCERGVSSKPCGECSACREIDAGRFVDLLEIDAASNTGVDDVRELIDNARYAPARGRFKVYLIDEVHMLSKPAFNALLKTLEEPPPHVKFLLATTDPQKLPVTVLSRCLQFNLKRLPVSLIQKQIIHILEAEQVPQDPAAVLAIARAADGSLRDALSLLDQAIAYGAGQLREPEVRAMLGSVEQTQVRALLTAMAARDAKEILALAARLDEQAPDYGLVLDQLATCVERMAVGQALPSALADADDAEALTALAGKFTQEDLQLVYQILLFGKRDLPLAPTPRAGFEMTLLRLLAFAPAPGTTAHRLSAPPLPRATAASPSAPATAPAARERHSTGAWKDPDWMGLTENLTLQGAAQQLALNCAYQRREGNMLYLELSAAHGHLATEQTVKRLEDVLSQYYGEPLKVRIQEASGELETPAKRDAGRQADRLAAARAAISASPEVRELCGTFGTEVNPELVKPVP
ncbi:MAG: DNA polymerase III subunit gamma/tau [Gammaproteobacteria bacterium]